MLTKGDNKQQVNKNNPENSFDNKQQVNKDNSEKQREKKGSTGIILNSVNYTRKGTIYDNT